MDTLVSVLQRLEAKLDATYLRPSASRPPRPDSNPPYGMSSEWQAPSWTSEGLATHSVGVSIPPWPPTMSSISSWPQSDPFRQNLHEYTNGMGFHTTGPHQYPSWEPPRSRAGDFIGHRSSWEQSASQGPSSSYEFDPILGRPLTSWDLPRPRITPESCSNHSDWDYWVPPTYSESYGGGGGYSTYSNNYNDYYNNESQARSYNSSEPDRYNNYESQVQHQPPPLPAPCAIPPPPSRDGCYVPPPPSYTPPQQSWGSSCFRTTPNDARDTTAAGRERERGVSGLVEEESLMVEEENKGEEVTIEADVNYELERSTTPLESEEEFIGDESEEAPVYDVRKKTLEFTEALMDQGSKVAKERDHSEAIESFRRTLEIEGFADIISFLELCKELDLLVMMRAGPNIGGEWRGFPAWWLAKDPAIKLRSSDPTYFELVEKWWGILLPKVSPLLYSNGGPIVMVQVA